MRYDAFISYSHAADDALAPAIQRGLQTLARPWNRRRALEIFRDQTGLAVSPGLWSSICAGLDESRHFVLLASPGAAASHWVNQEIERWAGSHSIEQLLPVLTDGEWIWDPSNDDFDWERSTAVPAALRGRFTEEPRHLDLRWARSESELDLRHSRFREAVAQLAAPMHDTTPEDLESSDVARFRHVVRLRRAVIAVLAALLLLVSAAGVVAVRNAREAQHQQALANQNAQEAQQQQTLAERQARRALALQLLAQAKVTASRQKTLSLLLVAEAARLSPDEAWGSLVSELAATPGLIKVYDVPAGAAPNGALEAIDPNTKVYATVTRKEAAPLIELWDLRTGEPLRRPLKARSVYGLTATQMTFGPGGTLAVSYRCLHESCPVTTPGIRLWDVATRRGRHLPQSAGYTSLAFNPSGDRLAATAADGSVRVWNTRTAAVQASGRIRAALRHSELAFNADGTLLALSRRNGARIEIWRTDRSRLTQPVTVRPPPGERPLQLSFGGSDLLAGLDRGGGVEMWHSRTGEPAGRLQTGSAHVVSLTGSADALATSDDNGSLQLWDADTREPAGPTVPSGSHRTAAVVTFDQAGHLVSIGADVRIWDSSRWGQVGDELFRHASAVRALAVSSDDLLASGDERGVIRLRASGSGQTTRLSPPAPRAAVTALAFSPDGTLASGDAHGAVWLWDPGTGELTQGPLRWHDGMVTSLAFSPDGALLAAGFGPERGQGWRRGSPMVVWDVAKQSLTRLPVGFVGGTTSVAFGTGGWFAAAGEDFLARWDVATWQNRILNHAHPRGGPYTAVAFTADGRILASGAVRFARDDARTVALWRMPGGQPSGDPLAAGRAPAAARRFTALAFSPDGDLLAGASAAGVQLWDVHRHEPLGGRLASSVPASSVVVSPDGRWVIAGDADGRVVAYPATRGGWLGKVCGVVSRNLSRAEWATLAGADAPYVRACPRYP